MRALPTEQRKQLETAVLAARRAAEGASRAAIDVLGVFEDRRPAHLDEEQARLRNALRAKWRQLGGNRELLVAECAYEQWHRLLFARFLAENDLLLHPRFKAPVSLEDCVDFAAELGEPDGWSVAARFAAEILPGIFRLDDPCVQLRLAPEGRDALERILADLPREVFLADDALGWVYQFWQKDKKDEINRSERKIGGADIGPVTQLFTENYMVRFLLENSLGAWWAGRHPTSPLLSDFEYLRYADDGSPAAGTFDEWPKSVAEVTVMDPCCGSGHFLVEAFSMLWQMRHESEGLEPAAAQDAVLRDNLFGLEIDPRCVEIAMFAVALKAWKDGGGWRELPTPNIACSGIPVKAPLEEWLGLADGDLRLETALKRLHGLFKDADTLGSLIDPRRPSGGGSGQSAFDEADWESVAPLLGAAAAREQQDPATAVLGRDAAGLARSAGFLGRSYLLVATNPPFLGANRQAQRLKEHLEQRYGAAKSDLAVAFLARFEDLLLGLGAQATVSPSTWTFLATYSEFRRKLVNKRSIRIVARLGPGAFAGLSGHVVQPALAVLAEARGTHICSLDAQATSSIFVKDRILREGKLIVQPYEVQDRAPDARILFADASDLPLLERYADSYWGLGTGDGERFTRYHFERPSIDHGWVRFQGVFRSTGDYRGRDRILFWEEGAGQLRALAEDLRDRLKNIWQRGQEAWGKRGVVVNQSGTLYASLYGGEMFQNGVAAIVPKRSEDRTAVWEFVRAPSYEQLVRQVDSKIGVTNRTLLKVPIDIEHWRKVAEEAGPLPEPYSSDPTQWLFKGRPEDSTAPLQVAVARLLGYHWPEQAESDDLDELADPDGIVCLPTVAGEAPAADRLPQVLARAYGDRWSLARAGELIAETGSKKKNLADWLRDDFFRQHCALFHNRPFVWQIWDGRRDGFAALVNYHRLDRQTLGKLTYTYLGQDWMERQQAAVRAEEPGAEDRLAAARSLKERLEQILEGEPPYDIYVRWKPLPEQPIGWEPDLDDGVRLNIRPFVEAGVLRSKVSVHWRKDRGKNPDGSERLNDIHLSLDEKREARRKAGVA